MANIVSIIIDYGIPFIFTIGLLVIAHELGHFLLAKRLALELRDFLSVFHPGYLEKRLAILTIASQLFHWAVMLK